MINKYYKQCIAQNRYRIFAATKIIIPLNGMLLDEFNSIVNRALADQRRITPAELSGVFPFLEKTAEGVSLMFVFVPPPQSDFFDLTTWGCDEEALRALEKKLGVVSKEVAEAIKGGNNFAIKASQAHLHAEDVRAEFEKMEEQWIARGAAKRSKDKEIRIFELQPGPSQLGGEINLPLHYPSSQDIILKSCKFHRWQGTTQALLESPTFENDNRLTPCLNHGKLKVKFLPDSPEEFALDCAKMSRVRFDIVVNLTEELSPQRVICNLMGVTDEEAIINAAKVRIEARLLKFRNEERR